MALLTAEWRAARSAAALEALLRALADLGAPRARVVKVGEGRDGRAMLALELGPPGAPGVVVVPGTLLGGPQGLEGASADVAGGDPHAAVDALLDLARELVAADATAGSVLAELAGDRGGAGLGVRGAERDRLRARLAELRVVVLCGARPDLLAPELAAPGFDLTRNFPVDGDLARHAGGGPYPLAVQETLTLARWLDAEPACFAALVVGAAPLRPEWLALGSGAADVEQARLLEGPRVRAAYRLEQPTAPPAHGGFARHARLRAGLAVVALPAPPLPAPRLPAPRLHGERSAEGAARTVADPGGRSEPRSDAQVAPRPLPNPGADAGSLLGALLELLDAAPRLELALETMPRAVGAELWEVEAVLSNVGGLATANVAHARERRPRALHLTVEGGELVAAASQHGDGPFEVVEVDRDDAGQASLRLRDLDAGGRLGLRLFVRAAPDRGNSLERASPWQVRITAPRAAPCEATVHAVGER